MEGLASIALAVAQLEQQHNGTSTPPSQFRCANELLKHFSQPSSDQEYHESPTSDLSAAVTMPSRRPFSDGTARLVSTDSSYSSDGQDTRPEGNGKPARNEGSTPTSRTSLSDESSTRSASSSSASESLRSTCESSSHLTVPAVVSNPSTPSSSPPATVSSSSSLSSSMTESSSIEAASLIEDPQIPASAADLTIRQCVPPPPPPTQVITDVLVDDVLCGRGGETNHHPGNIRYRTLVKCYQPLYIVSKRRDKPRIAQKIVWTIRERGGRFLKRDARTNTWRDVGNVKAREKTSQALREGAPELRNGKDGVQGQDYPSNPNKPASSASKSGQQRRNSSLQQPVSSTPSEPVPVPSIPDQTSSESVNTLVHVTAAYPSLVENDWGSSKKRKRSSISSLLPGGPCAVVPVSSVNSKLSAAVFAATVSADDDEDDGESCKVLSTGGNSTKRNSFSANRGPRLKRLKHRLEASANDLSCLVAEGR